MNTYDLMTDYSKVALERSKKYNGGYQSYSFAFGWFTSEFKQTLDDLGLSKKQMKILEDRLAKLQKLTLDTGELDENSF